MRGALLRLLAAAIVPLALAALALVALLRRRETARRRRAGEKPRLVYGPTPVISIKYMGEALRRRGYATHTFVFGVYAINERSDYDASFEELFGGSTSRAGPLLRALVGPYVALARTMRRGDVFHFFFDGGFLRGTAARFLELQLLHLAGKKVVVMPYGSDVVVPTEMQSLHWRHGFAADYPRLAAREHEIRRWIRYLSRHADLVVGCLVHVETLPRWDLLTTHYYPVDTDSWAPAASERPPGGPLRVFHSANHRALKGTEFVERACRELEAEGVDVELVLAQGVPNAEVRRLLAGCDVLAEQFVLGYGLAAMEGMALGKPVLSNLADDRYYEVFRRLTGLDECPIVSTTPETLKDTLRDLARDHERRRLLGEAGRRYVLAFHSYPVVAAMWEQVYAALWRGEALPSRTWHPGRLGREEPVPMVVPTVVGS